MNNELQSQITKIQTELDLIKKELKINIESCDKCCSTFIVSRNPYTYWCCFCSIKMCPNCSNKCSSCKRRICSNHVSTTIIDNTIRCFECKIDEHSD